MVELETAAASSRDEQHLARSLASRSSETHAQERHPCSGQLFQIDPRGVSEDLLQQLTRTRAAIKSLCFVVEVGWRAMMHGFRRV